MTSMSPKVVCRRSFFTLAPDFVNLPGFLRSLINLPLGPCLQGNFARAAQFLDNPHFRFVGQLQLAYLVLYGQ